MPHQRKRIIEDALLQKLKLWPSLGLLGMRQCGKSTFLGDILKKKLELEYITMDSETSRSRAEASPESMVELRKHLLVIDEVQKVPKLFDAIKSQIDQKRRPGSYLLSGSTAFSEKIGIRESLTGRIGVMYLYPFNLEEIHQKPFSKYWVKKGNYKAQMTLKELQKKLNQGGMPGMFYLHSESEFSASIQMWIETTCIRDLARVIQKSFDPDLSIKVFSTLAKVEKGSAFEIASKVKKDVRVVKRYLDAFCEIFALLRIQPHEAGVGKDRYLYADSGIASFLRATTERVLESHVLNEALSTFESQGLGRPQIFYYQSAKKSYIPFIFEWLGRANFEIVQIADSESISLGQLASVESFIQRLESPEKHRRIFLYQGFESYTEKKNEFYSLRS